MPLRQLCRFGSNRLDGSATLYRLRRTIREAESTIQRFPHAEMITRFSFGAIVTIRPGTLTFEFPFRLGTENSEEHQKQSQTDYCCKVYPHIKPYC